MTSFLRTLRETAIFMLGAQILLYLGPGKKYEKYGKMIVSLLLLAQLAEPVLGFGRYVERLSFSEWLQHFEQENDAFLDRLELMENSHQQQVWEGLVLSVEEQLADLAGTCGVRIERVEYVQGKIRIETGWMKAENRGSEMQEKIREAFAERLGVSEEQLEVVFDG